MHNALAVLHAALIACILAACDTAGADACTTPTPATTGPDDTGADTGATGGAPKMTHLGDSCDGIYDCSAGQFCLLPWGYCSTGCDPAIGIKDCADIVPDPFLAWTCEEVLETNLCVRRPI